MDSVAEDRWKIAEGPESYWLVGTTKVYSGVGAEIVVEIARVDWPCVILNLGNYVNLANQPKRAREPAWDPSCPCCIAATQF